MLSVRPRRKPTRVGLLVVGVEGGVDGALLAEALGHHDPADRLLDLGVDLGRHAAGALRDRARDAPKAERDDDGNRAS